MDTGIRLSDTKKSSDETRPTSAAGTRRCSSVPHTTIGAENSAPQTKAATATSQMWVATPIQIIGRQADAPGEVHQREVAARHRDRPHHDRADRPADAERRQDQRVRARPAVEPVLHQERDQHLERTHDHQDHDRPEDQRGQQPGRPHHVGEALLHVHQRRPHRVRALGGGEVATYRCLRHRGEGEQPERAGREATTNAAAGDAAPTTRPATAGPMPAGRSAGSCPRSR